MNADHLGHIVRYPDEITVQDALELEELCRKFPAFSTPFVLLARYYHQKGDYRAEEAVQLAALRVFDREWLYEVVHGNTALLNGQGSTVAAALPEAPEWPEEPESETAAEEVIAEIQPEIPEAITVAELQDETPAFTEPETTEVTSGQDIDIDQTSEPAGEPMFEPSDEPVDTEPVYQEIQSLNADSSAEALGITGSDNDEEGELVGFELSWEHLPDAGGLITPMTEEEVQESLMAEPPAVQSTSISAPAEEPAEEQVKPRLIRQAAIYDIEQYYKPETAVPEAPSDFYSWLKNPSATAKTESTSDEQEGPDHRDELIDRFIRTNPSISRPKKEFFTPEAAAKKSESLPDYLVTETLAQVYLKQENPAGAIRIYEKLILKFPEKTPYFAALIEKIRKDHQL